MYNSVGSDGGSSFGISYGDVKGGVVPRNTQNVSQKYGFWFDGIGFVTSLSRYYPIMIHPNKDRSYYLLYHKREDKLSTAGDCGGSFGRKTTHLCHP